MTVIKNCGSFRVEATDLKFLAGTLIVGALAILVSVALGLGIESMLAPPVL